VQIFFGTTSVEIYHQYGLTYTPRNIFDVVSHHSIADFAARLGTYLSEKWLQVVNILFKLAIALGAVYGILAGLFNKQTRTEIILLAITALYLIVLAGPQPYPRFGIPAWPILCILAGYGIAVFRTGGFLIKRPFSFTSAPYQGIAVTEPPKAAARE
jgi:hypothetical protein